MMAARVLFKVGKLAAKMLPGLIGRELVEARKRAGGGPLTGAESRAAVAKAFSRARRPGG